MEGKHLSGVFLLNRLVIFSASDVDKLNRPIHPATKTFQALRIVVNDELNDLYNGLEQAYT